MDLNTCFETTNYYHTIAFYTHLLPFIVSSFLGIYLLIKTRYSLLSKIFFVFVTAINVWLIADLVAWTQQDYHLIQFFWSLFDYANIIFFLFGLYFLIVLAQKKDISVMWKILGFILTLPAFYLLITGTSVGEFDQAVCESYNSELLNNYKNYIESFVALAILFIMGKTIIRERDRSARNQILIVGSAILLFFATFAGTDYVSVQTGVYEIGLYGLFTLPIFLGLIVYSIVKYRAFNVGVLGAQALVLTLIVLIGAQFFFIQNTTNAALNSITFLLSTVFGYYLVKGVKRDLQARQQLEKLAVDLQRSNTQLEHANIRLKELDEQKTEFISLATHQLRGPLGSIKGYASMALEGDYGQLTEGTAKAFDTISKSAHSLIVVVNDYLDVSRIEQGRMKFDFSDFDMKDLITTVHNEFIPVFKAKGLEYTFDVKPDETYRVHADMGKIKQVISNLVDNCIKYTPSGSIHLSLEKKGENVLFAIKDTGVGIKPEVMPNLFAKFSRAPDASKTNILGTGLGLYVARKVMEAHQGRVWAESEGEGKGSQFYVELKGL